MSSRRFFLFLLTLLGVVAAIALTAQPAQAKRVMIRPPRVFHFEIDDAMPLHELLPAPPTTVAKLPGLRNGDLTLVPELLFGEPLYKVEDTEEKMAHIMAKINRLNAEGTDGFLKTLLANRGDLAGMPFLMGKDCRTEENQAKLFADIVGAIQARLQASTVTEIARLENLEDLMATRFWADFKLHPPEKSMTKTYWMIAPQEEIDRAIVAALMQMLTAKPEPFRAGLVKHLTTIKHPDAARALAKLIVYSPEESLRTAAIDGLKWRKSRDYADVLLQGFRYPLPAVSKRAAEALVKLQVKDALADLVNVLEQPDPRAPAKKQIDGKEVSFVRELVRVNHHHNCLLCHAPANTSDVPQGVLTAPVALPNRDLPSAFQGYGGRQTSPDIFVRIDMTYLRQDFSLMMQVENAKPWPEMQRFDFFVRTRILTAQEAADCANLFAKWTPPSHAAAQYALRELTGQTPTEATPQAWRRLLKL